MLPSRLSSEEGRLARFLCGKQHIFWSDAPPAAIGSVQIPIGRSDIVGGREPESFCGAIDGCGLAFEFEDDADRSFIEVQVQAAETEGGAEFFVSKTWTKSQGAEDANEVRGILDGQFAFGTFLVTGLVSGTCGGPGFRLRCGRGLKGQDRIGSAAELRAGGRWSFDP